MSQPQPPNKQDGEDGLLVIFSTSGIDAASLQVTMWGEEVPDATVKLEVMCEPARPIEELWATVVLHGKNYRVPVRVEPGENLRSLQNVDS